MPLPAQVHIDTFLTGILSGTANENLIANQVLPPIFSTKLTGKVAKMGDDHYRVDFATRKPGTPGTQVDYTPSSTSYDIDEFRLEHPVDDSEVGEYDDPFDAYVDGTFVLDHKLNLKKEIQVASLLTTTANYASGHTDTGSKSWATPATGTPVTDVGGAVETIIAKKGVSETNMYGFCSFVVFKMLRLNDEVKASYLNTVAGGATPKALGRAQVAAALGLADLYVCPAVYITSNEGASTTTKAYVWGAKNFGVFYKGKRIGKMFPAFGYQVSPRIPKLPDSQVVVDRYRAENLTSEVIRARLLIDQIVGDNELGYLFTNVT